MSLSESELNEIKEKAEKKYPIKNSMVRDIQTESGFIRFDENKTHRDILIAALTSERQRSKVLLDALEKISRVSTTKEYCHELAKQALDTYMNKNKEI